MDNKIIECALACRLIDQFMKQHNLVGPLTDENLARTTWNVIHLLRSREVRAMYDEDAFDYIDVDSDQQYKLHTRRLVNHFVNVRLNKNTEAKEPLTEEDLHNLIGDFQDIVWNSYGDLAIRVD